MKKLPLDVQSFGKLIDGGYLYVDKTQDIFRLLTSGGQFYFMSRPRRFGKSLLVSTLKEIFSGNRERFKGLWIYDKIDWQAFPVIHIDFLGFKYRTESELNDTLNYIIDRNAETHGVVLKEKGYDKRFRELITGLSKKGKVVVLVDEYDKPIIDFVDQPEIASLNRNILRTFYSNLKGLDEYIKFVFITGVSKFSKVSVFSDLNNLIDITIDDNYSAMMGYTQEELLDYFDDHINMLQEEGGGSREEWLRDIKEWYNGYSWDGKRFVYNPYSVMHFFRTGKFSNYWFESGTPSLLVKLIRKYRVDVKKLERYRAGEAIFSSFEPERLHVVSLLFQTGYLTVKEVETKDRKRFYILSYPNIEVKTALIEYLLGDYSSLFADEVTVIVDELKQSLESGEVEKFIDSIRPVFAGIPYDIFVKDREGYYHTVIYLLLLLLGTNVRSEVETNLGRIDAVVETEDFIYIMEFKIGSAEEALTQIKEKKYFEKFRSKSKTIKIVGIGFDIEKRNIGDYLVESV